jgi:hypothetical protein
MWIENTHYRIEKAFFFIFSHGRRRQTNEFVRRIIYVIAEIRLILPRSNKVSAEERKVPLIIQETVPNWREQ